MAVKSSNSDLTCISAVQQRRNALTPHHLLQENAQLLLIYYKERDDLRFAVLLLDRGAESIFGSLASKDAQIKLKNAPAKLCKL